MSLNGVLNIGKSALAAQQAAMQVTTNNVANAGNPQYTRQVARLTPAEGQQLRPGMYVGGGVALAGIERQIDESLQARLRDSAGDVSCAQTRQQLLARLEAVFNELGDDDLSSRLSAFFGAWSGLANNPQDAGLRTTVIQTGRSLAQTIRDMRQRFAAVAADIDADLAAAVEQADSLTRQIADLNGRITAAEGGASGSANTLRDQRDALLGQLCELLEISFRDTGEAPAVVMAGTEAVVAGNSSRGLTLRTEAGSAAPTVAVREDGATVSPASGRIGGLLAARADAQRALADLDALASALIWEANRLHSSGQGLEGYASLTAANAVRDTGAALNSAAAGLDFAPVNGSFVVHVRNGSSGLSSTTLIKVDLSGTGPQTTLESLRESLDAVAGVSASISNGRLRIATDSPDLTVTFSDDSSGVLAALRINVFFTGSSAEDIGVDDSLAARPSLLAAAANGQPADNQTARALADLENTALRSLNGGTLAQAYERMVQRVAAAGAGAATELNAAQAVAETLAAQREATSGVSLDEEAINLIRQQRAFQGAAKIIAAVDEMLRTLLQMV